MARTTSITPNQTFLHGADRYEAGKSYDVSKDEADYFKASGWVDGGATLAGDQDVAKDIVPENSDTQLEVQNLNVNTNNGEAN